MMKRINFNKIRTKLLNRRFIVIFSAVVLAVFAATITAYLLLPLKPAQTSDTDISVTKQSSKPSQYTTAEGLYETAELSANNTNKAMQYLNYKNAVDCLCKAENLFEFILQQQKCD